MRIPLLTLAALPLLAASAAAQSVSFGPAASYATIAGSGWTTNWLAVADVTGDGRPDAVALVANYNTYVSRVAVLPGTAAGALGTPAYYAVGRSAKFLAVADLNADGRPDVVTADDFDSRVSVLLNTGTGALQPAVTYSTGANTTPKGVAVADLNADGRPDLVVGILQDAVAVLPGTGGGAFGAVARYATPNNSSPEKLAVADFNADGQPDVLASSVAQPRVWLLPGAGTGALPTTTSYAAGTSSSGGTYGVAAADFNADNRPDVLTTTGSGVGVLLASAGGTLQAVTTYPVPNVQAVFDVAAADVNGDGRPDALTANYPNTASVLLANANGTLQVAATFVVGSASTQPTRVVAADLNADGRPDLLTANYNDNTVSVLLNTTPLAARAALPGVQVALVPNPALPAGTTLTLANLPAATTHVQLTLLDVAGRVAGQQVLAATQGTARALLPTAELAPGLYLVQLTAYDDAGELGPLPTQRLLVQP